MRPPAASLDDHGPDARFRFAHRLTAEAAYGAVLHSNRTMLHSVAADVLAQRLVPGAPGEAQLLAELVAHLREARRPAAAHTRCCALLSVLAHTGDLQRWQAWYAAAGELWTAARTQDPTLPALSLELLWARGMLDRLQGRLAEAEEVSRQALALTRQLGDPSQIANSYMGLGAVLFDRGQLAEAVEHFRPGLAAARRTEDRDLVGRILNGLGIALYNLGAGVEARASLEESLHIAQELGNLRRAGMTSGNLGVLHDSQGRKAAALACYQYELAAARAVGNSRGEGMALSHLGGLYLEEGRYDEAQECFLEDLASSRAAGDRANEGIVLGHLAGLADARGDTTGARRLYVEAYSLALATDDWRFGAQWLMNAAAVELSCGELAAAGGPLAEARRLLEAAGDMPLLGRLHCTCAELELAHAQQAGSAAAAHLSAARHELAAAQTCARQAGLEPSSRLAQDIARVQERLEQACTAPAS